MCLSWDLKFVICKMNMTSVDFSFPYGGYSLMDIPSTTEFLEKLEKVSIKNSFGRDIMNLYLNLTVTSIGR